MGGHTASNNKAVGEGCPWLRRTKEKRTKKVPYPLQASKEEKLRKGVRGLNGQRDRTPGGEDKHKVIVSDRDALCCKAHEQYFGGTMPFWGLFWHCKVSTNSVKMIVVDYACSFFACVQICNRKLWPQ